jgi:PAS domain S-box-containing protein
MIDAEDERKAKSHAGLASASDSTRIGEGDQQLADVLQLTLDLIKTKVALAVQIQQSVPLLRAWQCTDAELSPAGDTQWQSLLSILRGRNDAFHLPELLHSGLSPQVLAALPPTLTQCAGAPVLTDQGLLAGWILVAGDRTPLLTPVQLSHLQRLAHVALPALQSQTLHDQMLLADVEARMKIDGRLLTTASDMGRVGAWWIDLASNELYWSKVVREIHEVDPPDILNVDQGIDFYAPEHQPLIRQALEACIREGTPFDLELELITAKGRRIWVRAVGQAVRDTEGTIVRVQGAFQDIDRFKRTEQSLSKLEKRLDRTLEAISDGFATLDRDWRMTYVNQGLERFLMRPRESLLNQIVWDAIPTAKGGAFEQAARRALAEQSRQTLEFIGDASGVWLQASIYPSPEGVAVYLQDISERRRLQEEILNNERRFRAVTAAVADVVWELDVRKKRMWWGEGLESRFGYPPEEVVPEEKWTVALIHPDDRDRVYTSLYNTINSSVDRWESTYRFRRRDGSYALVRDRGYVIRDDDGRPVSVVGAMQDETERLTYQTQLEEQAALLNLSTDAIIVRGLDHKLLYWNRGAEKLYGWSTEETIGFDLSTDLASVYEDPSQYYLARAETIENGQWHGRLHHQTFDGRRIIVLSNWTLMRDEQGTPKSILTVHTDITQQLEVEEQLRRAQRLEAVGQLTGGIAHDFNNLLTVIQGNAELLTEALQNNPRLHRFAQMTFTAAQRGADLTSRLLAFARRQTLEPRAVDVNRLLTDMNALIRRTLNQSIEVALHRDPNLWHASVDPAQLETALLNLCFNARDAMPMVAS